MAVTPFVLRLIYSTCSVMANDEKRISTTGARGHSPFPTAGGFAKQKGHGSKRASTKYSAVHAEHLPTHSGFNQLTFNQLTFYCLRPGTLLR